MTRKLGYAAALFVALASCLLAGYLIMRGFPKTVGAAVSNPHRIEIILKARANPPDFWRIVEQGVVMAADEFGAEYNIEGPEREIDVARQTELLNAAIERKPDAIVLAACDYNALAQPVEAAVKSGINVVMIDSDVNSGAKSCLVATDNRELGKKLGELVDELIEPSDKFGVVGHVETTATAIERSEGLLQNVWQCERRLAEITYCDGSAEIAKRKTIEMLEKHPDIKCMVGLNESSALGIAQALEELQLGGEVRLVACDSSQAMIRYMENGTIQAFVVQNPFNMGYLGLQAAVSAIDGKKVEPVIFTESIVITKENMSRQANQKLLFPFTE